MYRVGNVDLRIFILLWPILYLAILVNMADTRNALPRRKACSECYRSRRSCDHRRPSCSRCLASRRTCIYSSQVRHRGTDECANDDALANSVPQQGGDLGSGTPDSTSSHQELSALPSTSPAIQPQVESFASFDTIDSTIEFPPINLQVDRLEYETMKYCERLYKSSRRCSCELVRHHLSTAPCSMAKDIRPFCMTRFQHAPAI